MTIGRSRASVLVAAFLMVTLTASSAHALNAGEFKCLSTIYKTSQKFVLAKLKLIQKCKNAYLKDGSCTTPDPTKLTKLETKLTDGIGKGCEGINTTNTANLGFPGPCADATPTNGFTLAELQQCILQSHSDITDQMIPFEYDATLPTPLSSADLKCQAEVAKQSGSYSACLLKNVAKCRYDILKGKIVGVPPDLCATNNQKTEDAIAKCEAKFLGGLTKKCTPMQVQSLLVCDPNQNDAATATDCLTDAHGALIDRDGITVPADLIDYEFATRPGSCGDNIVNNLNEECDGPDDANCPGQCGTALVPDGFFACLCKTKPRMVVAEHADADTDNGWLGLSVDGDVVEGGGYIVDLYDCDGMTGICNAGPSCSLAPHSPCGVAESAPFGTTSDSICAGLGQGTCRKERTATGPHCYLDPQKKCSVTDSRPCTGPGDSCVLTFHGAPVAAAAGGVAVCNVSTFSEDIVGTVNILTNESSLKVRQRARTHNALSQSGGKPCPVCGNYCALSRDRCTDDLDCGSQGPCITAALCSDGLRQDKVCRKTAPFGGPIPYFGTTSIDCPPDPNIQQTLTSGGSGGLDINANPRTTGSVTRLPSFSCTGGGAFGTNRCLGGSNEGRVCTTASECPGGSCTGQCFCSGQSKANGCASACVGGSADMDSCSADSDCPGGGFCHTSDCRVNPLDTDSNQEGICSAGPIDKFCSITSWHSCTSNAQCNPPFCPDCQGGETCDGQLRQCFVNSGITRTGTPGYPERETASVYCVPSNNIAIDQSAGFPGPGALIQRETVTIVP